MSKIKNLLVLLERRIICALGMSIFLTVLFVGTQTSRTYAASWSFVRIFHASPDAGIVDVFMDGSKILSNFQYGTLTGYTPIATGSHKLQIGVLGSGTNAAILSQTLSLQADASYSVVVLGTKSTGYTLQVFTDNNSIDGNLAKARVYHMSPGAGVVNVNSGGNTLISNLPYAQASKYVNSAPGSFTFNVVATHDNTRSSILVDLKPWTVTSIFVIASAKDGSVSKQFQFVQAQITGMPGMPKTGSDPRSLSVSTPAQSQPLFSGPGTLLILAMLGIAIPVVIKQQVRRKHFKSAN